jgi:hypothetical protein
MRILKILLISTALAAFGAGSALATTAPLATTGQPSAKPKSTKHVKKKAVAKKKVVKAKRTFKKTVVKKKSKKAKKYVVAKAAKTKKKPAPSADTESAPGSPPGSSTN